MKKPNGMLESKGTFILTFFSTIFNSIDTTVEVMFAKFVLIRDNCTFWGI